MNINHISVSRKKCFDLCQQQYKYKYHLKIPSPTPEPFYFIYGTIVHKIAEIYVKEKMSRNIGEIAIDIIKGKIPIEGEKKCPYLNEEYKKKLQRHLKAIQNLTKRTGCEGLVEHKFRFDLDPPNEKYITGFIDRLIIKGDGEDRKAFIIDYKTTKKGNFRLNNQTVLEDLQLRCYSRMVQKEFNIKANNIKAALYYLEGENLVAAQYNNDSLERVEEELKNGFIQIETSDPDKVWGNVGWHCKNCEYNTICQFYKQKNNSEQKWNGSLIELGHDDCWNFTE
jgi:CRISPR/Cas system-associated exonuclease Cas4 (RecB family)